MLEKRKTLYDNDVRPKETRKKRKTKSTYFEESSNHINVHLSRVPFGTLHNILNTSGGRNSLSLQTTSPLNLSTNKENIKTTTNNMFLYFNICTHQCKFRHGY